jgi:hypothetical protein
MARERKTSKVERIKQIQWYDRRWKIMPKKIIQGSRESLPGITPGLILKLPKISRR